jgi:RNA polymerase sigma factor (TIGR02999 family)
MKVSAREARDVASTGEAPGTSPDLHGPLPANGERTAPIDPERDDVSGILDALSRGDGRAGRDLLPLVYAELRRLAARSLAREPAGHTLQATALVHEAYLRLVGADPDRPWDGRGHFFAAAAEAMRRILVEAYRRKHAQKRGGGAEREELDEKLIVAPQPHEDLLALDEALGRLAQKDPAKAELVKLRYFAGLTLAEAAQVLGISENTADRHWAYAKAWLHREITAGAGGNGTGRAGKG